MSKLSIIVPIYNTEDKIEKCIKSIITQKVEEIEIIVINDGSTDNSGKKVKELEKQYPQKIKYYEKENEGIAKTRNYGIEKATSNYIMFIDSDDYLEPNALEKLEKYIDEGIDIIKFKIQRVDEKGKIQEKVEGPVFEKTTGEDAFSRLYPKDVLLDSPCAYIISKKIYEKNKFRFVGKYHEDFGLIPVLIITAETVVSTPYYLYNYVQGQESITRTENYEKKVEKSEQILYQYDKMLDKIKKIKISKKAEEDLKIYYTNAIILETRELRDKEAKKYIKEIRKRKMHKNIKIRNIKQLIKRIILAINIKLYLKIR